MNTFLYIAGIVIAVASVAARVGAYVKRNDEYEEAKFPVFATIAGVILGAAIFILGLSFTIVPTGYTGVKSVFGQIDPEPAQSGFNWKIPFIQKIELVNNKQQDIDYNSGTVWSESEDQLVVYYEGISVTYQINPEKSAWVCANVANYKDGLISANIVSSAIKTASHSLPSNQVTNRGYIEPASMTALQDALDSKYGKDVVFINRVVIYNADFEDSYNQVIAEKQNAQMAYEKQQIENKTKVEAAEADAKVKVTQAQAEADAAVIKAQGEADANKLLDSSLTDKILRQNYLEKWNGALPKVSLADGSETIIDIGDVSGE